MLIEGIRRVIMRCSMNLTWTIFNVIRIKYSDVNKTSSLLLILPENHSSICQHASPADVQPRTHQLWHISL